ncbi:MAG: aspartate--tRNA ligase [Patescibacteria group bacterium]|nr:aspartate--tRNA ligase [Patescibacteria group bacterium]
MRTLIEYIINKEGELVELFGWVEARRDHGKLIFIDLKDRSDVVQAVFLPKPEELREKADELRPGWVVKLIGKVNRRPENMRNPDIKTGDFEIQAEQIEIINKSETSPFDIYGGGYEIGEETRMMHRYLDLRRPRLGKNIKIRSKAAKFIRDFLEENDFIEIETPILSKSTPEGARDYLVPSRLDPENFYALPQSPQQYKQLLMVAGFERYFQIAKCFRDEDTRGDRQPEFTQIDLEMSFVDEKEIMDLNEEMIIKLVGKIWPDKKIQQIPFPKISYQEAMEKYGADRPDLRENKNDPNLLAFCWITDFPFFEKDKEGKWTFTHNPFSAPKSEDMDKLVNMKNIGEIKAAQYDIILNGFEIGGGSVRNHDNKALIKVFEILGYSAEQIENNFSHMIKAFSFGAPPHGGIAYGFDRLIAILQNEPNIREVIAFPKTGDGRDLMMQAPSEVDKKQLDELGLKIKDKK